MAQSSSSKGDLRGAAAALERGIEKYGEGDLAGALVEFEAALKLYPASARGKQFVAWVKDVQAGKRSPNGKKSDALDEDALRAVDDALIGDEPTADSSEPTVEKRKKRKPAGESQTSIEPPTTERRVDGGGAAHVVGDTLPTRPERDTLPSREVHESPWDPVPLTPTSHDDKQAAVAAAPAGERASDRLAELQAAETKAAPPPSAKTPASSSTILGMPALEPKMLTPQRKRQKVAEDRPESVTREFKTQSPTGPGLKPLDVPELTEEQIQGLLSLDSPLLPEGRTTPQLELERIDGIDDSPEADRAQRLIEMEALPTPIPAPAPPELRRNDTNPMGVGALTEGGEEFDPNQLTPTGIKPQGLKAVAPVDLDDDPYADLNLLPLEVAPDLSGPEDVDEGTGNPTNPFIRGARLAQYTSFGGAEPKLEDMPPLPGARTAETPAGRAEASLQAGDVGAAVDACEAALAESGGGLDNNWARDNAALIERIYSAILVAPDRVPQHGVAVADLEPRSAFLLSRLDGSMTVEDVLDVSGMPRLEAMRTLALLVRRGAVVIK